jgi:hypothetical protein
MVLLVLARRFRVPDVGVLDRATSTLRGLVGVLVPEQEPVRHRVFASDAEIGQA